MACSGTVNAHSKGSFPLVSLTLIGSACCSPCTTTQHCREERCQHVSHRSMTAFGGVFFAGSRIGSNHNIRARMAQRTMPYWAVHVSASRRWTLLRCQTVQQLRSCGAAAGCSLRCTTLGSAVSNEAHGIPQRKRPNASGSWCSVGAAFGKSRKLGPNKPNTESSHPVHRGFSK